MAAQHNITDDDLAGALRALPREDGRSVTATMRRLVNEEICRRDTGQALLLERTTAFTQAVAVRRRIASAACIERLLTEYAMGISPLTIEQAQIGHAAYRTDGIGSGHRARLNVGGCFSYALAKSTGEPLLFKGDHVRHTDVPCAIDPD